MVVGVVILLCVSITLLGDTLAKIFKKAQQQQQQRIKQEGSIRHYSQKTQTDRERLISVNGQSFVQERLHVSLSN